MKCVIHKFVLGKPETTLDLEYTAKVLYAGKDSRSDDVAIWVLRYAHPQRNVADEKRKFRVLATGDEFEGFFLNSSPLPLYGPVRLPGGLIFHVLEVR